jgi:hypothetical protein
MPRETFQSQEEKTSVARSIRSTIGRQLQAVYAPQLKKPLPQRLADLLRRLADRNGKAA